MEPKPVIPISVVMESLYCPRNAWYAFVGERRNMASSVDFIEAIHAHKHILKMLMTWKPSGG